ncbi:right-handed parallel beta-helix repeat-containing protein [Paenibacillus doosanensis]|uniref:choice-of-anchor Q domain-containing protein n=1 Tax=Paenibacillus doosanensis TaxID=1229154 RepID=UPI00217F9557|nr:right-handed parallel beta-helix repeat-containing protein [Paenibacillus doosanensis]MCS7459823.1 right-handed parallel beta-helix repeat-containing protein [Paenibacillus doosanensis]
MLKFGKRALIGLSIAALGLALGNAAPPKASAAGTEYYVSPTGNDSNAGTLASPWKTLQHAADTAVPGSTVYVRGGTYNKKLSITRSGSAAAGPITFTNYASELPVIDGTGLSVTEEEGLVQIIDASYITVKGFEIRNFTTSTRNKVPVGIYVEGAGSGISLLNNKVHDIKNTATPTGSDLLGRDAHGIAVYGSKKSPISGITIDGNELYNLVLGSSESLVVNGNVDTFAITNNLVHDNDNIGIDVIGFEGTAPSEANDQARNGLVKGNVVYNISSNNNPSYGKTLPNGSNAADGIYVDGGKDTVIEQNYSYNNDIGIEIASEHKNHSTSNITVRNNIVYNNRYTGIAMGGYDTNRGSTTDCKIVNNTLYKNDTVGLNGGQLLVQYDTKNNVIKNNIMAASSSNYLIYNGYTQNTGNTVDYNLYFAPAGSAGSLWKWKNTLRTGFSAYQTATGNDAHSLFADPQFVNEAGHDFHLKAVSPAIDAGYTDTAIIGDYDIDGQPRVQGAAVNIGADE